jgi:glycosidase
MNRKVLSHYDVMTVGEMPGDLNPYEASKYVAKERKELSMVFQLSHMTLVSSPHPSSLITTVDLT